VSVATEGSAIAPEQYIAMSTARGFMATGVGGCCVFFEAHERLDFFKALPPPVSHGTMFILCVDVERRFCASGF
jgi:hypothetical protein